MPAPKKILDLIGNFERNADHHTSTGYKEALVRQRSVAFGLNGSLQTAIVFMLPFPTARQ
jgi:hypothetical protein